MTETAFRTFGGLLGLVGVLLVAYELDAAIARVCTDEVQLPYPAHLEQAALPQADTIAATTRAAVVGDG